MLNAPTPFPQVGAYALIDHEGSRQLARIVALAGPAGDPATLATIALAGRPGAGGTLRLPLSGLIDGTPLSPAEHAELGVLDAEVDAARKRTRAVRIKEGRASALRLRRANAAMLADAVAKFEARRAAARRAG